MEKYLKKIIASIISQINKPVKKRESSVEPGFESPLTNSATAEIGSDGDIKLARFGKLISLYKK